MIFSGKGLNIQRLVQVFFEINSEPFFIGPAAAYPLDIDEMACA